MRLWRTAAAGARAAYGTIATCHMAASAARLPGNRDGSARHAARLRRLGPPTPGEELRTSAMRGLVLMGSWVGATAASCSRQILPTRLVLPKGSLRCIAMLPCGRASTSGQCERSLRAPLATSRKTRSQPAARAGAPRPRRSGRRSRRERRELWFSFALEIRTGRAACFQRAGFGRWYGLLIFTTTSARSAHAAASGPASALGLWHR